MHKSAFLMLVCAVAASAQPSIRAENGVLNASSYLPDIARGSWFVIFGSNMGPASIAIAPGAPFPETLTGTQVTFTPAAGGPAIQARIWYTVATQVAGLLPSSALAGDYDVRVIYNGQPSAPRRVRVVDRNFGFATVAQNGAGPAQATNASLNDGISLVRFTSGTISFGGRNWQHRPAYTGETLVLWGTGLGPDAQSDVNGGTSGDQTAAANVRVIVGTTEIVPAYAGRSSGSPGLDQINFTLPANIPPGCTVNLQVRAGGRLSNLGSIAIANRGETRCAHPTLSETQLRTLDLGGTISVGALALSKVTSKTAVPGFGTIDSTAEAAVGAFSRFNISQIADANFSLVQQGACTIYRRIGDASTVVSGSIPQALNAGSQLTLNGPNASNRAIPREAGAYSAVLYNSGFMGAGVMGAPTLVPGAYTIAGPGGPDVGPFTATVNFPGAFTWTNENQIPANIPRNQNLTIQWSGGGDGVVMVSGFSGSRIGGTQDNPIFDLAGFTCVAPASAGTLTVPSGVLQQLPRVSGDLLTGEMGMLSVLASSDPSRNQGVFNAAGLDFGFFSYSIGTSKSVGFN
jgi:uncharacterized protein (TIGR03437 family)